MFFPSSISTFAQPEAAIFAYIIAGTRGDTDNIQLMTRRKLMLDDKPFNSKRLCYIGKEWLVGGRIML